MTHRWRDLSPEQQRALAKLGKAAATAGELGCCVSTFIALEKRGLIRVETTLNSIAFPRKARAEITDAGHACLVGELTEAAMNDLEIMALKMSGPLGAKAAELLEQVASSLKQAVQYADVVSHEDGMPEGKQATRLTATWLGQDIHYRAEFDVKAARALCDAVGKRTP